MGGFLFINNVNRIKDRRAFYVPWNRLANTSTSHRSYQLG